MSAWPIVIFERRFAQYLGAINASGGETLQYIVPLPIIYIMYTVATLWYYAVKRVAKVSAKLGVRKRAWIIHVIRERYILHASRKEGFTREVLLDKSCYDSNNQLEGLLRTGVQDSARLSWMTDVAR